MKNTKPTRLAPHVGDDDGDHLGFLVIYPGDDPSGLNGMHWIRRDTPMPASEVLEYLGCSMMEFLDLPGARKQDPKQKFTLVFDEEGRCGADPQAGMIINDAHDLAGRVILGACDPAKGGLFPIEAMTAFYLSHKARMVTIPRGMRLVAQEPSVSFEVMED